jgi:hypothetical protein
VNSSITDSRISSEVEKELQEREADNESWFAECVEFTGEDTDWIM